MDKFYRPFIYNLKELEKMRDKINGEIEEMVSKKTEKYNDKLKLEEAEKMILKTLIKLRIALNPYIDIGNTVGYNINTYTCSVTLMKDSIKIDFMPICHFVNSFEYIRDKEFEKRNNKDVKWLEEYAEHTNVNSINFYGEKEIKMEDLVDETDGWTVFKLAKSINVGVILNGIIGMLRDMIIADYLKDNLKNNLKEKMEEELAEEIDDIINEKLEGINECYNINIRMKLIEFVKMLDVYIKYMYE